MLLDSELPSVSKRCTLDLPGFKNLEGLTIACFSPNDSPQTLAYKDELAAWEQERNIKLRILRVFVVKSFFLALFEVFLFNSRIIIYSVSTQASV